MIIQTIININNMIVFLAKHFALTINTMSLSSVSSRRASAASYKKMSSVQGFGPMYRGNWIMGQMVRRLALGLITSRQFHNKNLSYFTLPSNFQHKYQLRGRDLGGGGGGWRDIC